MFLSFIFTLISSLLMFSFFYFSSLIQCLILSVVTRTRSTISRTVYLDQTEKLSVHSESHSVKMTHVSKWRWKGWNRKSTLHWFAEPKAVHRSRPTQLRYLLGFQPSNFF